jgi:hypothetical protein
MPLAYLARAHYITQHCRGDPQARMLGRKGGSWCKPSTVPQL